MNDESFLNEKFKSMFDDFSKQWIKNKIIEKIKLQGINLTDEQVKMLMDYPTLESLKNFEIEFEDDQVPEELKNTDGEKSVKIDFNDADFREIEEKSEKFINDIPTITKKTILEISKTNFDDILRNVEDIADKNKDLWTGFEKRLFEKWHKPLILLSAFIQLTYEICDQQKDNTANTPKNLVLRRLGAKALLVSREILSLMRSGFSAGAEARWRTLHEISVAAHFIAENDEELATKYIDFNIVDSYRAATQYQEKHKKLGYEPIPKDEFDSLKLKYDETVKHYGSEFKNRYGWASKHLNKEAPNFSDLEDAVKLDHWRPYYKNASFGIHAGPKLVFNQNDSAIGHILAGPSDAGLYEPGMNLTLSLFQFTTSYLLYSNTNFENLVKVKTLKFFVKEIQEEFLKFLPAQEMRDV